jgi:hypothetical protein
MADDDVQLTYLEVIQQFSLAVRGATASRADVIAALEADLAYLGAGKAASKVAVSKAEPVEKAERVAKAAPAKKAAVRAARAETTRTRRA